MKTYIFLDDSVFDQELKKFTQHKMSMALSRFEHLIDNIEVRITDENGPKGGDDKSCALCIQTHHFPDIIIRDLDSDPHAAVSRAFQRAKRTIARRLKQSQAIDRQRLNQSIKQMNVSSGDMR